MSYNPSCFFSVYPLPFYMKDSVAEEMSAPGAAGERERESESEGKRESGQETQRQRERGIETDWFPPPAASVQSQPADFRGSAGPGMSPAGPSCLSAGRTSPGGPGTVRRHQKNNYADRRESCARSQTRTTSSVTGKITPCTVSMTWLVIHRSSKMIDWDEINNRNRYPFFKSK